MFKVYHKGCGGVAFFTIKKFTVGDVMNVSNIVMPDGTKPKGGDQIICGACKKPPVEGLTYEEPT